MQSSLFKNWIFLLEDDRKCKATGFYREENSEPKTQTWSGDGTKQGGRHILSHPLSAAPKAQQVENETETGNVQNNQFHSPCVCDPHCHFRINRPQLRGVYFWCGPTEGNGYWSPSSLTPVRSRLLGIGRQRGYIINIKWETLSLVLVWVHDFDCFFIFASLFGQEWILDGSLLSAHGV